MAIPDLKHQASDGSEEEDDDFNPQPPTVSDNEDDGGKVEDQMSQKSSPSPLDSTPPPKQKVESDDEHPSNTADLAKDRGGRHTHAGAEEEASNEVGVEAAAFEHEGREDRNGGLDDDQEVGEGDDEDVEGEDEEEEEEEDDEEDEQAVTGRPRKRRRKGGMNRFFEEEAEVDEDDDAEDDEDDLGNDGFVADTHPDDLAALPEGTETDDRRHRELDRRRELEASMDAERQAAALRERYRRRPAATLSESAVIPKRLLLPGVDDPSIWGVKCKVGKEKEVILSIMKRMQERQNTRQPVQILSAFERGAGPMAGYIYVEALKKADVENSLEGIMNVYPRSKLNLVSVKEMPDLLRVTRTEELQRGAYVRVKKGLYIGDLGVAEDVDSASLTVTVRLVPRLNYRKDEDDRNPMMGGNPKGDPLAKRKRANAAGINAVAARPPQRLFNENEAKKRPGRHLAPTRGALTGKAWTYNNDTYEDGFLIKDFKMQQLITQDVNPKLDEVTKLTKGAEDGTERIDLESLAQSLKNNTAEGSYQSGDHVEVHEGEQKGIYGRVVSVAGNIISIRAEGGELAGQVVDVPMKGLRKRFREGDHVQVIGGSRYRDEVGMILRIKDDRVTVRTDMSSKEITVFSKDLREAGNAAVDARLGNYDIHDLIQMDPATVGCVVKVDRESMRVLDQNSSIRQMLPSQVTNKIEQRKDAIATDRNGSEIRYGDIVREFGGESKSGTIIHIHRAFVFVHDRTQIENSGVFVARCVNVTTIAAKGGRATATDAKNPPFNMRNGGSANGQMAPPRSLGRDKLLGKTVTIRKGPFKGVLGIVKNTTETTARVEMHSKAQIITVDKEELIVKDPVTGQTIEMSRFGGLRGYPGGDRATFGGGSAVPRIPGEWAGGRTPMGAGDGGRTPAWGAAARTPAWAPSGGAGAESGRTPAWRAPSGSQTAYGGAGNSTSYGGTATGFGGGGRTPAWSSGRTPHGGEHGFSAGGFESSVAGGRTPAQSGAGSRTPAWGGAPAPTPGRPYDAPTPGARLQDDFPTPYGAPTPAMSAPTPRFAQDAPTPRGWDGGAPTPAAARGANTEPLVNSRFDAPTPAASASTPVANGGGYGMEAPTPAADGPRYIDSDDE